VGGLTKTKPCVFLFTRVYCCHFFIFSYTYICIPATAVIAYLTGFPEYDLLLMVGTTSFFTIVHNRLVRVFCDWRASRRGVRVDAEVTAF